MTIDRQVTTSLQDATGDPVEYSHVKFGAQRGVGIGLKVAKVLAGPLADFLGSVDPDEDLDVSGLGRAVGSLPQLLLEAGGFGLFAEILSTTKRGRTDPATGQLAWADLSKAHNLDAVYAGNYIEMFRAALWVLKVNFAPFGTDGTQSWGGLLSALGLGQIAPRKSSEQSTDSTSPQSEME